MTVTRRFIQLASILALVGEASGFQIAQRPSISRVLRQPRGDVHQAGRPIFSPDSVATIHGGIVSTSLQSAPVALPSLTKVALSCILPTSLGFYKSEYSVSYGYGTSVALLAYMILQQLTPGTVPYYHALALFFYGTRLNIFLLYREVCIPSFRKFRETIEEKAPSNRFQRAPFILSCAVLYACLAAPLFVTSTCTSFTKLTEGLVTCTWIGFLLAAFGDLQKSVVKARNGEDTLVTGGVFHFLRHPNFTGETIGWTSSFLVALSVGSWKNNVGLLAASALGWSGIVFVLAMAATSLEKKQKEKYGGTLEYKEWVKRSWAGITIKKKDS